MTTKDNSSVHVAVWLDKKSALLKIEERSNTAPDQPPVTSIETLTSNAESTVRSTGGRHGHFAYQHQTVQPAVKAERRREAESLAFMRQVIGRIEKNPEHRKIETLLVAGPGEAKKHLASELRTLHPEWPPVIVSTTSSRLSQAQKLATLTNLQTNAAGKSAKGQSSSF